MVRVSIFRFCCLSSMPFWRTSHWRQSWKCWFGAEILWCPSYTASAKMDFFWQSMVPAKFLCWGSIIWTSCFWPTESFVPGRHTNSSISDQSFILCRISLNLPNRDETLLPSLAGWRKTGYVLLPIWQKRHTKGRRTFRHCKDMQQDHSQCFFPEHSVYVLNCRNCGRTEMLLGRGGSSTFNWLSARFQVCVSKSLKRCVTLPLTGEDGAGRCWQQLSPNTVKKRVAVLTCHGTAVTREWNLSRGFWDGNCWNVEIGGICWNLAIKWSSFFWKSSLG